MYILFVFLQILKHNDKRMKDDNIPLNNLNISPSENSSKFDWLSFLHLITPIALAYVSYKGKKERDDLHEKLNLETKLRKDTELKLKLKEQGVPIFETELFQKEIEEIKKEEETKAKLTLQKLSGVENSIKQILDIRCSPLKPKAEREPIERYLLNLSQTEQFDSLDMENGLNQIFQYDKHHCGGGYHNNGQIYRVWMQWWRAKIEHDKNSRITARMAAARKADLYTTMRNPKYS